MITPAGSLLAVDDDPDCLDLLEGLLRPLGHRLRCFSDAELVIPALQKEAAELILMDIEMPGLDGLELCRRIQADPQLSGTPIIFVTARQDEAALAEAFEAGGRDYLTKPFRKTDILARIGNHLALRRAEKQLQQQLAFRELMLTMLSHDLRGPLGTASTFLEQLIAGPYSQFEMLARLSLLKDSLSSTHHLLEQTLDWARSTQQELPFCPVWCDLERLALDSLDVYRLKAQEKNISLALDVPGGTYALLDPDMIRTALLNLINNALKYTHDDGKVSLKAIFGMGELRLSVSDTGTGMSIEQKRALEAQIRVMSHEGTAGEKGSGLGIKICQELAGRHGGHLEIQSSPDTGSHLSLVLPCIVRFNP